MTRGHLFFTLHHLHHLNLAVLFDELGSVHVTTAHSNDQPPVDDLGHDISLTELILTLGDTLNLDREVGFVQVLSEGLVDHITLDRLVELDLLQFEHFFAQTSVLVVKVLALLVEGLQIFEKRLDASAIHSVHFQHGKRVILRFRRLLLAFLDAKQGLHLG